MNESLNPTFDISSLTIPVTKEVLEVLQRAPLAPPTIKRFASRPAQPEEPSKTIITTKYETYKFPDLPDKINTLSEYFELYKKCLDYIEQIIPTISDPWYINNYSRVYRNQKFPITSVSEFMPALVIMKEDHSPNPDYPNQLSSYKRSLTLYNKKLARYNDETSEREEYYHSLKEYQKDAKIRYAFSSLKGH